MEIRIEKVGNRIHLKCPYRADIPGRCKSIAGANWAKTKRVWTFPLDFPTCLQLRKEFQHALKIGPALSAWAKEAKKKHEALLSLAAADGAALELVAEVSPALANAMGNRPYQQIGSAWLSHARQALLGDHPGLGKTLQAMGAIVEAQITGPILVFAPKTAAIITWTSELKKWLPNDMVYCVTALVGKKRDEAFTKIADYYRHRLWDEGEDGVMAKDGWREGSLSSGLPEPRMWVLCNIEMARMKVDVLKDEFGDAVVDDEGKTQRIKVPKYPGLFDIKWSAAIVDESHNGLITRYSQDWKMPQHRAGMHNLQLRDNAMKTAMSGTPMRGKLYNLWGTLNWLRPDKYPSFWNWVKQWFEVYDNGYGMIIGELLEDRMEDFYRDLESIMLRRTKAEVLADLPAKMYAGDRLEDQDEAAAPGWWLPVEGQQWKNYQEIVKNAAVELEGGHLTANGLLAEMTRLQQLSSASGYIDDKGEFQPCLPSNKFDWLLNFLTERGIAGDDEYGDSKVIIASRFTRLCNMFARELEAIGVKSHLLTGETSMTRRKEMVEEFQSPGGPRVFILNTKAGGVSLTLDAADEVVILDETGNPDDQEQVEDRAHRASRMHQVTIHYVRSLGTIEEEIATDVGVKESIQKQFMDGRRGVDIAKKILGIEA